MELFASAFPGIVAERENPDLQHEVAAQILHKLTEVKTYLAGEMTRNTKEVKSEIQALGAQTADLEQRVETIVEAHNGVVIHSEAMAHQIDSLKLIVEDLLNCSRRNNLERPPQNPQ
ncbi:Hypothetical predicted protein [Pelobates cultripes]|uniref:Uncharacterized protein n=1 Tax=Pelobates cultripes TaxID=61616 RepID=A0AAD1RRB7_PELCU|nr:Hypothetical predicted protein [Pelobates cultripes]